MIPIYQVDSKEEGFRECLASVLEVPLEDVPEQGPELTEQVDKWLSRLGLALVFFRHTPENKVTCSGLGYSIMEIKKGDGRSSRPYGQYIIMNGEAVAHEPNKKVEWWHNSEPQGFYLFVPIDPADIVKRKKVKV